jgi:hypothetical protein
MGSWLRRSFRGVPRYRWINRGVTLSTAFTVALLLVDLNRDGERCEQECYGTYRTYEPGHPWTNYPEAWQWDAQNALEGLAFLVAAAAFVFMLAARRRRAVQLTVVSLLLSAAWIIWIRLSPPIG